MQDSTDQSKEVDVILNARQNHRTRIRELT